MQKAKKITREERCELQILHTKGYSARAIALAMGRSPNTIAAELKRNSYGTGNRTPPAKAGVYDPRYAHHLAYVCRHQAKFQGMKVEGDRSLREFVVRALVDGWNPDEIAGYLKRHQACASPCGEDGCGLAYISKTALYDWLRSSLGQPCCPYLPSKRYRKRKRRGTGARRVLIPDRVSIQERPDEAASRLEPGQCEGDTVVSGKRTGGRAALAVFVERQTRFVAARLIPDLRPTSFTAAGIQCLAASR